MMPPTMRPLITIFVAMLLVGCVSPPRRVSDTRAFYSSLSPSDLSLRFVRPDLYDGLDDFARPNALQEILNRRLLTRGMHMDAVRQVLGHPDSSLTAEGSDGIRIGQAFEWHYNRLPASGLVVHFGADERVTNIRWAFEHPHESRSREY